jgi:hypothetical protein
VKERCRDKHRLVWLEDLLRDVRFAGKTAAGDVVVLPGAPRSVVASLLGPGASGAHGGARRRRSLPDEGVIPFTQWIPFAR